MKKKIIASIMIAIMVFSVSGFYVSYADRLSDIGTEIDKKNSKLEQGNKKEGQIGGEIDELAGKINAMQDDIDIVQSEINNTEYKISVSEKKLKKIQKKIKKQSTELNARLKNMYMNDNTSFLEVLLNSGSLSEALVNLELLKKIHKGDKKVLAELETQHEKVEKQKRKLDKLRASLGEQRLQLEAKKSSLESEKAALNKKKRAVATKNDKLVDEIADLKAEADALTTQIKSYGSSGEYSGSMIWPVSGSISSEYGYRWCPFHGYELHTGIDISVPSGTSVKAASSGVVREAYYNGSYGNMVLIDHGGGIYTLYAHNSSLLVSAGTQVSQGQVIALAGSTGNSTGPHVHFEVRVNGQYVNPRGYL